MVVPELLLLGKLTIDVMDEFRMLASLKFRLVFKLFDKMLSAILHRRGMKKDFLERFEEAVKSSKNTIDH